jgi:hypothetical protein
VIKESLDTTKNLSNFCKIYLLFMGRLYGRRIKIPVSHDLLFSILPLGTQVIFTLDDRNWIPSIKCQERHNATQKSQKLNNNTIGKSNNRSNDFDDNDNNIYDKEQITTTYQQFVTSVSP